MVSSVALVSAPKTTPSLKMTPTMVVPVLVAFGKGKPFFTSSAFLKVRLGCYDKAISRYLEKKNLHF